MMSAVQAGANTERSRSDQETTATQTDAQLQGVPGVPPYPASLRFLNNSNAQRAASCGLIRKMTETCHTRDLRVPRHAAPPLRISGPRFIHPLPAR